MLSKKSWFSKKLIKTSRVLHFINKLVKRTCEHDFSIKAKPGNVKKYGEEIGRYLELVTPRKEVGGDQTEQRG